jgi:hypothetical protein
MRRVHRNSATVMVRMVEVALTRLLAQRAGGHSQAAPLTV